jgi:MoxR-like ATPase
VLDCCIAGLLCGKTQLAYAVAQAANTTVERLQCYQGIGEDKAIGRFDELLQQLCVELKAMSANVAWESLKTELHGQQFLPKFRQLPNQLHW